MDETSHRDSSERMRVLRNTRMDNRGAGAASRSRKTPEQLTTGAASTGSVRLKPDRISDVAATAQSARDSAMLTGAQLPGITARRKRRIRQRPPGRGRHRAQATASAGGRGCAADDYDRFTSPDRRVRPRTSTSPRVDGKLPENGARDEQGGTFPTSQPARAAAGEDRGQADEADLAVKPTGPTAVRGEQARDIRLRATITTPGQPSAAAGKQYAPIYVRIVERRPDGVGIRAAKLPHQSASIATRASSSCRPQAAEAGEEATGLRRTPCGERTRRQDNQRDLAPRP